MLTEAESAQLAQEIPVVAQVKVEHRDNDLREWGKDLNEWVVNGRKVRKEYSDLKAEHEKLKAEPKGIRPLSADSKPEDVVAYRKAFGVPDKPEGYQFKLPEGMPSDVIDPEEQKAFAAFAHDRHLPQSVYNDIVAFEVQNVVNARKIISDEQNAKAKELAEKLSTKYGDQAQAKVDAALKFVEAFGSPALRKRIEDKEHPDPMGNDADLLELLINAGALVSERGLLPGGMGAGAVSAGEPEYDKIYVKSFKDGHMHK
jgi:hypothetical protein